MKHETGTYGDPALNYEVHTEGDAPSSIEISRNAKGEMQVSLKLYLASADALADEGPLRAVAILTETERLLTQAGYVMAGGAAMRHSVASAATQTEGK